MLEVASADGVLAEPLYTAVINAQTLTHTLPTLKALPNGMYVMYGGGVLEMPHAISAAEACERSQW